MEDSSQGRGISALVAINAQQFLVLERNNRGVGVDADLSSPNKKVFRIDLIGATDVTDIDLDAPGAVFTPVTKQATPWLDLAAAPRSQIHRLAGSAVSRRRNGKVLRSARAWPMARTSYWPALTTTTR